jgi:hypothetical protein
MAIFDKDQTNRFEDMSDADLMTYIGGDIDPTTSRADLIEMAKDAEQTRRTER